MNQNIISFDNICCSGCGPSLDSQYSILNDIEIKELCEEQEMISPFKEGLINTLISSSNSNNKVKVISYGLSSYGYDIRVAHEFKIFTNINNTIIDPKNFTEENVVSTDCTKQGYCILPPNSFCLARTVERFKMPDNVLGICSCKSTYARCGIFVPTTILEPGWEGYLTLEFANTTTLPAKIYINEGCAQIIFFRGNPCNISYADRNGKYMNQVGVVLPKV